MIQNSFSGERLKAARVYNGLSVAELAEKLDLQRQTVSMYENNKIQNPDYQTIKKISDILNFPLDFFLQSNSQTLVTGSTYFRSQLTTNKKYRALQVQRIAFITHIFAFLKEYIDFPDDQLPEYKGKSPEEAAIFLRESWKLGDKPLSNLAYIVEQKGVIISSFESEQSSIDAFSQLVDISGESRYIIGYSTNNSTAARIHFDIAHELGHMLLHEWSEDVESLSKDEFRDVEAQAHSFASAFLLPKDAFLKDLGSFATRIEHYETLKRKWKVSISAMIRRAYNLDVISYSSYQSMMRIMQKRGIMKFEPLDDVLTTSKPTLLAAAVEMLIDQKVFSPREFVGTLSQEYSMSLYPDFIEKLLGLKRKTLYYEDDQPSHRLSIRRIK